MMLTVNGENLLIGILHEFILIFLCFVQIKCRMACVVSADWLTAVAHFDGSLLHSIDKDIS